MENYNGTSGWQQAICRGLLLLTAAALLPFAPLEQSQAQLFIHVYPSQDNPTTQTLWIFSGSSTAFSSNRNIRTSSGSTFDKSDALRFAIGFASGGNIYSANKPNDQIISLSPLFSSSNTDDIVSVSNRTAGVWGAGSPFANNATNTPTITLGSGSRTISHLFMSDNGNSDEWGIRVSGSSLPYTSGNSSVWVGAGLINKPIGDFIQGEFWNSGYGGESSPRFSASPNGSVRLVVNSQIIPEPEEYALIFALFALGFIFFHRRRMMQKKQRLQQSAATTGNTA